MCPSNRAALYGIKPTVGLVSRAGVIPVSLTQDTVTSFRVSCVDEEVGPMAKSVFDAALILSVIAGKDPRDTKSIQSTYTPYL
jgi:amidase